MVSERFLNENERICLTVQKTANIQEVIAAVQDEINQTAIPIRWVEEG